MFVKGVSGNPKGRPVESDLDKTRRLVKKATTSLIKQYQEDLASRLEDIKPILVGQALEGKLDAIKEVHQVTGAYPKKEGNVTAIQVNINEDREKYG